MEDDELTPAAEVFAELGQGLHDALFPPDHGGITDREVLARRVRRGPSALMREMSTNRKLSPVENLGTVGDFQRFKAVRPYCASTFASIEVTCPDSCSFKDHGCMADAGFTRMNSKRLNTNARGLTPLQVTAEEAREIDKAFGGRRIPQDGGRDAKSGRDLRLHIGGDVTSDEQARLLAAAAWNWSARGGGAVWTFTHAWRIVDRSSWGTISVLASIERPEDAEYAFRRGYAPAIVIGRRAQLHERRLRVCSARAHSTDRGARAGEDGGRRAPSSAIATLVMVEEN